MIKDKLFSDGKGKADALTPQKLEEAPTPSFWALVFSQLQ